jgi:hypothetical protein
VRAHTRACARPACRHERARPLASRRALTGGARTRARRQLLTDALGEAYTLSGISEEEDIELVGIATDWQAVQEGDLFVCLKARCVRGRGRVSPPRRVLCGQ